MKKANPFPDLPLRVKVRRICLLSFSALLLALIGCVFSLSYCANQYETLFGVNYVQSSALGRIGEMNALLDSYGEFPTEETRAKLRETFRHDDAALRQLSGLPTPTDEQRMLTTAISRTYDTYLDSVTELLAMPITAEPAQVFYLQCSEALEIGGYVDAYLKQLIQQTLTDGHTAYETQLRLIRLSPVVIALLLLLSGVVLFRLSVYVTRDIVQPVSALAEAAQSLVARGMNIPDLPVTTRDEIGVLTQNFNRMKDDCRRLLVTQQEKEEITRHLFDEHIQRTDAERQLSVTRFNMLKNQINPHFLFNTLNLVTQTAQQERADQTELLVRQLSDLLRYTLYNTRDRVSLHEELENLYSYMYIQESRFPDQIGFWVDCRIEPDNAEIPAFTLQPLVENAVSHGVRPKRSGGLVRVKIWEREGRVHITITDNGVGMDRDTLLALRAGTYQPGKAQSGIGVGNVAARLKMLYPDSEFHLFSVPGRGTCIALRYPLVAPEPSEPFFERTQ